jgi:Antibiotic biosynthesis monooxygenase
MAAALDHITAGDVVRPRGVQSPAPTDEHHFLGGLVEHIQLTATLPSIAPGDLATFKELAAQALTLTQAEATTLQYDWFFSDDETKCVVRETYANSDAILAHMGNLGELIGKLAELGGGLEIEAFGTLSEELVAAAAAAGLQPTVYKFFQGK